MHALMKRARAFAEAVVIMVCPVLLAITLKKVDLKSKEHGRGIPIAMLLVGAITLICGIVPFLALCFSMWFSNGIWRLTGRVTTIWLAPISCSCLCLVGLACWVMQLISSKRWTYGFLAIGMLCNVIYSVRYCRAQRGSAPRLPTVANTTGENQTEGELDVEDSVEFLAGVTALLFLGLEGLALEGQINGDQGAQRRLAWPMGVSFVSCVLGVSLMLVETIPPHPPPSTDDGDWRRYLTWLCDIPMAFVIGLVMFLIMSAILKLQVALLPLLPPFLILLVHAFDIYRGGGSDAVEDVKPASLELSKVTFTGFLAVSIPAISSGSLSMPTDWFLMSAAWAVVSGLVWRLLTRQDGENCQFCFILHPFLHCRCNGANHNDGHSCSALSSDFEIDCLPP